MSCLALREEEKEEIFRVSFASQQRAGQFAFPFSLIFIFFYAFVFVSLLIKVNLSCCLFFFLPFCLPMHWIFYVLVWIYAYLHLSALFCFVALSVLSCAVLGCAVLIGVLLCCAVLCYDILYCNRSVAECRKMMEKRGRWFSTLRSFSLSLALRSLWDYTTFLIYTPA